MTEEILESSVNAETEGNVEPQIEQVETVKTETVEVVEPQQETKPVQSAEENAKFAQVRREAESKARDKTIADMGMEWDGQKITTYDQYIKAKAESDKRVMEEKIRKEYESKGLPDELIEEMVESKREREERRAEKQEKAEQERKNAEYAEFFEYFKAENGREYDSTKDTISQEVWLMTAEKDAEGNINSKRKTLADAYAINRTKELKAKIAEYEDKLKAQETNKSNAESTPGSLTGNGENKNTVLTPEMIESMSTTEIAKRWQEVKKVLNMK